MKKLLICMALMTCSCANIVADKWGEDWSTADTVRQVAVTGLIYYDLQMQTPQYLREDREMNPLITEGNLNAYTAASMICHGTIAAGLKPKYRKAFQWFWIIAQAFTVGRNFAVSY